MNRPTVLSATRTVLCVFLLVLLISRGADAFSFVVLGDSRDNGLKTAPPFSALLKEISLLAPDFMVHTGDWIVQPDQKSWEQFLSLMKGSGIPYHLVIGNHDISPDWKTWTALHDRVIGGPLYYSFKQEHCSFIILCCYSDLNRKTQEGKIDAQQFAWLDNDT